MRKTLTIVLAMLALAVPTASAWAAASAAKKVIVAKKSFTGSVVQADQWGSVQVTIVVRKTTIVGKKKAVKRHIDSITVPVFPDHTGRSQYISQQALPILVQEALKAQSTHIYLVSGATYTSDGFGQSLQAAIAMEKAW